MEIEILDGEWNARIEKAMKEIHKKLKKKAKAKKKKKKKDKKKK